MDPSEPALRQSLLQSTTQGNIHFRGVLRAILICSTIYSLCIIPSFLLTLALSALSQKYPSTSFHPSTQRYAVATTLAPHYPILLYDLRTATKWKILEGHKESVTALNFNNEGTFLVSYAANEAPPTVRVWNTRLKTFLGSLLGTQGKCTKTIRLSRLGSGRENGLARMKPVSATAVMAMNALLSTLPNGTTGKEEEDTPHTHTFPGPTQSPSLSVPIITPPIPARPRRALSIDTHFPTSTSTSTTLSIPTPTHNHSLSVPFTNPSSCSPPLSPSRLHYLAEEEEQYAEYLGLAAELRCRIIWSTEEKFEILREDGSRVQGNVN